MDQFYHSVTLDEEKCKGCINCIKRCPTEAIRVRNGKAKIITERCIDCGECIRVCPNHAKLPITDPFSVLDNYKYKIALPAPSLYGQFHNLDSIDIILNGLLSIGFDEVYEVSAAAEMVSDATRKMMASGTLKKPVISSACPAVTRLIRVRFPHLIDHVLPLNAPVELAARLSKERAAKKTGLDKKDIGAIFLSPCAAKATAAKMPLGTGRSEIDAVISISEIYPKLVGVMKLDNDNEELSNSGRIGVSWGESGGESAALLGENYLAADGIENVIRVLEDTEDEKFPELDFIELNACSGGCVGGVLMVENPYVAKARINRLRKYLPVACNHMKGDIPDYAKFDNDLKHVPVLKLADDLPTALHKMAEIEKLEAELPGLDCGTCGAPSCRAFAEDVVRGLANREDCVIELREHLIGKGEGDVEEFIPAPFRLPRDEGHSAD